MAAAQGKVIITCAVTGAIHTPTMSPYLPITPEEIAEAAIGAAEAGAAIVHLHARNPKDGNPTQDPDMFRQFLPKIKAASDVVINLTPCVNQLDHFLPELRRVRHSTTGHREPPSIPTFKSVHESGSTPDRDAEARK